jgi:hypothetical protein
LPSPVINYDGQYKGQWASLRQIFLPNAKQVLKQLDKNGLLRQVALVFKQEADQYFVPMPKPTCPDHIRKGRFQLSIQIGVRGQFERVKIKRFGYSGGQGLSQVCFCDRFQRKSTPEKRVMLLC